MILVDHQIFALCEGRVPEDLQFYYSSLWENMPSKVKPMVEPFNPDLVNPASLDVRIGESAKLRVREGYKDIYLRQFSEANPMLMEPGDRLLVASMETFCLPSFVCAEFKLKSSRGREWYGHQLAGFADPGWCNSKLTMELTNDDVAPLPIFPGLRIGQLIFHLTLGTPYRDYSKVGRYNGDRQVQSSKG